MKIVKYHRKHIPKICNDGYLRQIVVETKFPRVVHYPKIPGRPQEKINLELSGNIQLEMSREEVRALIKNLKLITDLKINPKIEFIESHKSTMEPFIQAYKDVLQAEVGTTHQNFDDLSLEKIRHDCVSFLKLSKEYLNGQNPAKVAEVFHRYRNGGHCLLSTPSEGFIANVAADAFKPLLVRSRLDVANTLEVLEA